ncbi:MAG: fibronectin type III domain-containing protein [Verrucomicrobiae bacterium]|nr:fibronectin type III domain-containing protein [Verrucomicrobiae bacterium]
MSAMVRVCERLALAGLTVWCAVVAWGQSSYGPAGPEYAPVGALAGDQVMPAVALGGNGGYLVWQDNMTDGQDTAIVAQRLGPGAVGIYGSFRVNQQGAREQSRPRVALLKDGGAVVVWQGNQSGSWDVYATFIATNGTLITSDVLVNTTTAADQINPAVAVLADGNVVITWGSFDQDGSYQGVYARRFSPTGAPLGGEFKVSTSSYLNQRTPAVAALTGGNFVVVWVSEHQTSGDNVRAGIFGQLFTAQGVPVGGEVALSTTTNICANPAIAPLANGGYIVVWGQRSAQLRDADFYAPENSWDVFGLTFNALGKAVQRNPFRINTFTYGDQYVPSVATVGDEALVVWTSLGQDGSREGVYGQFVGAAGALLGGEIRFNDLTLNQQLHPVAASNGRDQFLVVWTTYVNLSTSFDLRARRYDAVQAPLVAPPAPYITALSQSRLSVAWPALEGMPVTAYELYVDGSTTPVVVTSNLYTLINLAPASQHTVRLAYRLADGRVSPPSTLATGVTWGADENYDGLPDDWQARYWGPNPAAWPGGQVDSDGDGVSNLQEFLAGTDPRDPQSVLKLSISSSPQGYRLNWNTQPGQVYQVQMADRLGAWSDYGAPRLAATNTDSVAVSGPGSSAFYRVLRLR